jgi:hypothetical protein
MFPKHLLARRLRLRHSTEPEEAVGGQELGGALLDLCQWGRSQTWVVESRDRDNRAVRYLVDCPVLNCRREAWFGVEAADGVLDRTPIVLVALPCGLGARGIALGWGAHIATLLDGRIILGVSAPKSPSGLRALQRLLELAYAACFDPTVSPE